MTIRLIDMQNWFSDAKHVKTLEVETCFLLQQDFYYGPDTHPEIVERKLVEPVEQPDFPRHVPSLVRTSEVEKHISKLGEYYSEIISLARKHKMSFNRVSHYFWMRFWIWNSDAEVHLSFPWYDTQSEIDAFINSVTDKTDGQVYWDADQGWELEIHASGANQYARLLNPDENEIQAIVSYPRHELVNQLNLLQKRSKMIINELTSIIGRDLWTSRIDWPDFLDG